MARTRRVDRMTDFAAFDAGGSRHRWNDVTVRPCAPADATPCAELLAHRDGLSAERRLEAVSRWPRPPRGQVFVAEHEGHVKGYAKVEWLAPGTNGGQGPTGWYLAGVLVAPDARRHGIAYKLTLERIEWTRQRASELWCFVNLRNHASIVLHERLGFTLHALNFRIPGVSFTGGRGGLYRLGLC